MYLPYTGLFNKIKNADIFVIGDDAQYSKGYFYNRNRIKTPNGELMLTVPLKNAFEQKLNEVEIDNSKNWSKKHLQSFHSFYKKSSHFDNYIDFFEQVYNAKWKTLYELNLKTLFYFMDQLDLDVPIYYTSSLIKDYVFTSKTQKIIDICRELNASVYLSGVSGQDYIEPKIFEDNKIKLEFQNYVPGEYRQLWGSFIPNLSIVDLLFNLGEEARNII
jgi:hypothetical protein